MLNRLSEKALEIQNTYGVGDDDVDDRAGDATPSCSGSGGSEPVVPSGGCVQIASLQNHEKAVISEKALKILNTYGVGYDDADDEPGDAAPSCSGSGGSDSAVPCGGLKHST